MLVDRFGEEFGHFMSPGGAPFAQRALPPSALNATQGDPFPDGYHVYIILRPIVVKAGPIAPWFAQPGYGIQFLMPDSILSLVNRQYLARVNLTADRD
jgi:hypothetical protein